MSPHAHHLADQPILDVANLIVRYGARYALEDITFQLHSGERIAVVGPNGAGKSTLLKVVAGVLRPTSGMVNVFGFGPRGHVCIGYVPQRTQVDWRFPVSVSDVVMMGRIVKLGLFGWPKRKDWEYVRGALETVGIVDLAKRQIGELSGGQQQRMFIARSLAQEAELILMDEPLTGLDLPAQEGLLSLLGELKRKGATVMVATHDLDQAARYFDRILLLNHKVIAFGSSEAVLKPDILLEAYGSNVRILNGKAITDTCCDGDESGRYH